MKNEELILKELQDIKRALIWVRSGIKHLDARLRSTERLGALPQQDFYFGEWEKKIAEEEKKREEELNKLCVAIKERKEQEYGDLWEFLKSKPSPRFRTAEKANAKQEGDPYEYLHSAFNYLHKAKKE